MSQRVGDRQNNFDRTLLLLGAIFVEVAGMGVLLAEACHFIQLVPGTLCVPRTDFHFLLNMLTSTARMKHYIRPMCQSRFVMGGCVTGLSNSTSDAA